MDWLFIVIPAIIALAFVYVIGRIVYAMITGKGKDEILSGKNRPRGGQNTGLDRVHRNHSDF